MKNFATARRPSQLLSTWFDRWTLPVYRTVRRHLCTTRWPWRSALRGFVRNSDSCFSFCIHVSYMLILYARFANGISDTTRRVEYCCLDFSKLPNRWRCRLGCGLMGPKEPRIRWGPRSLTGDILGQHLPTIFVLNAICKRQHVAMRLLATITATTC